MGDICSNHGARDGEVVILYSLRRYTLVLFAITLSEDIEIKEKATIHLRANTFIAAYSITIDAMSVWNTTHYWKTLLLDNMICVVGTLTEMYTQT